MTNAPASTRDVICRTWADWIRIDATIVGAFLISRILVVAAAFVAEFLIIRNPALEGGESAPILRSLTSWDGDYYLGLVRDWYHIEPVSGLYRDTAFPPLFPMIVKILSAPWPQFAGLIAVLVSNVAFLVALGLLARLGEPYLGRRRSAPAASLLAIYPFASVFAMAYAESLFLLLMVGAFLAAERGNRVWTGILFALACLCRLQGVVLLLPLWIIMLRRDSWRPRPSQAWLALGPIAALAFFMYVGWLTGSVTGYLDAQQAWAAQGSAVPSQTTRSVPD